VLDLKAAGRKELELYVGDVYDTEFGCVTPTSNIQVVVYGIHEATGVVKCGIEQAYNDGKVKRKKPISCHLFPIITKESKHSDNVYVNYEPREDHCKAACTFGKKLKVPVYVFLKEALTRKFGKKFYSALEATAQHLNKNNQNKQTNYQPVF